MRDLSRYFYPLRFFTVNSIKSGVVPLWNPYIFCGTPHLALQQSVIFYPLSIIYYLFPFARAFNIFLVLHIFSAGLFVALLCRRWGFHESASMLAAIIFMFSGYIVSTLNLATTLSSCIWLPIILLFFDKALSDRRPGYIFLTSISLAFMFLGGEPSIFYTTLWALLFYSIFFWLNNRVEYPLKKVASCYFFTMLIGILLSSVQLIPFLELMSLADRTTSSIPYEYLTKWSLPLKDTFSFIIPFLTRTDFSRDSYWKEQSWVFLIYVGVFAIFLILLSILSKKNWRIKYLFFLGGLFLFISYGNHTPFYYAVYKFIPGVRHIRYPVRFLYATTFAIAMLCGAGYDMYIEGIKNRDERLHRFFKYLLFALYASSIIFLALSIYHDKAIEMARDFCVKHMDPKKDSGMLFSFVAAIFNMRRLAGFFTFGGLILYLGSRLKIRQGVISFAFISLVTIDLISALPLTQIMLNSKAIHAPTPNIEYLKSDKSSFRFFISPKTREASAYLEGTNYEEAIAVSKDKLTANWPMLYGLYDASGYDSIKLADYGKLMLLLDTTSAPSDTKILDMLNVKYLLVLDEMDSKGYKLVKKGPAYLYENANVLPRAFLVSSYNVLKNELDIANRLKSKDFNPAKEVILKEEPQLPLQERKLLPARGSYIREKVQITKYSPNEVLINAVVNSPKFLVLSDSYYPGWKAYVDGRPDKIYVANYILRAVYLDSGSHTVRFVFDPFSFKLGLSISLATFFICMFYIVSRKI